MLAAALKEEAASNHEATSLSVQLVPPAQAAHLIQPAPTD